MKYSIVIESDEWRGHDVERHLNETILSLLGAFGLKGRVVAEEEDSDQYKHIVGGSSEFID